MNLLIFSLIIVEIFLNVAAQLSLKVGMDKIGHFDFCSNNIFPILIQVCLSPWIILGIVIYIFSMIVWLMVLSRAEVSMVYPMTSLGYILSVIAAYFLLGEHFSFLRISGVLVIMLGVFLIARS